MDILSQLAGWAFVFRVCIMADTTRNGHHPAGMSVAFRRLITDRGCIKVVVVGTMVLLSREIVVVKTQCLGGKLRRKSMTSGACMTSSHTSRSVIFTPPLTAIMSPSRYRNLLDLAMNRLPYTCASCARTALRHRPNTTQPTRSIQSSQKPRQQSAQDAMASMQAMRKPFNSKNQNTLYYTLSIILGTVALSYGSVPLYKTICQQTGWGGQPIKSSAHAYTQEASNSDEIAARLTPVASSRRLRITFAGSTSDILPWKFTPQQREVRVLPGETALAFYTATNKSQEDVIGVATYSVTPAQVAPYFSKIQCFCFEEQRLNKGETVDMPVFFYIDPEFLKDPAMKGIDTITLNYTFFSKSQRKRGWAMARRLTFLTEAKYDKNGHLAPVPMPRPF